MSLRHLLGPETNSSFFYHRCIHYQCIEIHIDLKKNTYSCIVYSHQENFVKVQRRIFTKTFHSIILPKTVFIKHDLVKSCTVLGILFVFNTTTQLLKHFLISQRVGKHVCQMISIYLFHQHEVPRVSISFFHQHRCACCFYLCSPPSQIYHRFACCMMVNSSTRERMQQMLLMQPLRCQALCIADGCDESLGQIRPWQY